MINLGIGLTGPSALGGGGGGGSIIYPSNVWNETAFLSGNLMQVVNPKFMDGLTSFTYVQRFNLPEYNDSLRHVFLVDNTGISIAFYIYMDKHIRLDVGTGSAITPPLALPTNVDFEIKVEFIGSTHIRIYLDDIIVYTETTSIPSSVTSGTAGTAKFRENGAMTGSSWKAEIFSPYLDSTERAEVSNGGTALCYSDYLQTTKDKAVLALPLYNGANIAVGQEHIDQSGNETITLVGTNTFNGSANIECSI